MYEAAPDPEVNTITGSAETFTGLIIISRYNCDFEFPPERFYIHSNVGVRFYKSLKTIIILIFIRTECFVFRPFSPDDSSVLGVTCENGVYIYLPHECLYYVILKV